MKRKTILAIVFGMIALFPIVAMVTDIPEEQWYKTLGGWNLDWGFSVQQTTDSGYIITGLTESFTEYRCAYLIKTDNNGNMKWQKTFGGNEEDNGYSVLQTSDGGYIIAGNTHSYGAGSSDVYLIKTDSFGNMHWQNTFGGSNWDIGYSVLQVLDGGYIIAGDTHSYGAGGADVYLIKTDSEGYELWQRTFGGKGSDRGTSAQVTSDGGYIIAGNTHSYGAGYYSDVYLVKTDSFGNMQWQKTFGGSSADRGRSVQQTSDGGYIIAGDTHSYGAGGADVYLIKTDSFGDMQWQKTFGGSEWDIGFSVLQASDGGYIIAGDTHSYGAGYYSDVYLVKTDSFGNMQWQKTFGETPPDYGRSIKQTSDGGYIIVGATESYGVRDNDIYLIKIKGELSPIIITVDIKPGSFPNSINLRSQGNIPVAILSSEDFNATRVNPPTVTLAGASVKLKGKGTPMAFFEDINGDGLLDIIIHVDTTALELSGGDTEAVLEGETFEGRRIRGVDTVRIIY